MSGPADFWSRRRAAVAAEQEAEVAAAEAEELEQQKAELEEKTEAEILEELGLPDPDTLEKGDDFSVFMKGPVPDAIRRRALRKLWRSNPVLANLDNLVEYGEDYTKTNVGVEGLKTAYEVGRGFWKKAAEEAEAEAAAKAAAEAEAADQEPDVASDDEPEPEIALTEAPDESAADDPGENDMPKDTENQKGAQPPQPEVEADAAFARRKMKFRFLD